MTPSGAAKNMEKGASGNESKEETRRETKKKNAVKNEMKGETKDKVKGKTRNAAKGKAKNAVEDLGLVYKVVTGVVAATILVAAIVVSVTYWRKSVQEEEEISAGIHYLEELEKQDMEAISGNIKTIRDERLLDLADADEGAVWSVFDALNAMILGDSRAVGFTHWEFVAEERVLAHGGGKITDVAEELEEIKAVNPEHVFLCFGLNDVGIGYWPDPKEYAAVCDEQIRLLQETLPDATIYLNSILPAVGSGLQRDSDYPRIGEYNEALRAMCAERGYHFIDNTPLAEERVDLYAEDGLHMDEHFYKYWVANMLTEVD